MWTVCSTGGFREHRDAKRKTVMDDGKDTVLTESPATGAGSSLYPPGPGAKSRGAMIQHAVASLEETC